MNKPDFSQRQYLVVDHPYDPQVDDFLDTVKEVEAQHPDFEVPHKMYEKHRTKFLDGRVCYSFYLERVSFSHDLCEKEIKH